MVRVDIPVKKEKFDDATALAQDFINDLGQSLQSEQADYIIGEK